MMSKIELPLRCHVIVCSLQVSLEAMWNQAKHDGFWATWAHLVDLTDPRGEINAYKVGQISSARGISD